MLSVRTLFILCGLIFGLIGTTAAATPNDTQQQKLEKLLNTPLFNQPQNFGQIDKIADCQERTLRPAKYQRCRDSQQLYDLAFAKAKQAGQPLMVIFGFDTCPACAALDKVAFNRKEPMRNDHLVRYLSRPAINEYVARDTPFEITVVRIHARTDHGQKLADDLGVTEMARQQGGLRIWSPFILFVDPQTGQMHSESFRGGTDKFCDWGADIAAGLEGIGLAKTGTPYIERKRC
jgi:hypothetical protein